MILMLSRAGTWRVLVGLKINGLMKPQLTLDFALRVDAKPLRNGVWKQQNNRDQH